MGTTRTPTLIFSGTEAANTEVTVQPDVTYDPNISRLLIGETVSGTTCEVRVTTSDKGTTVTHLEATLPLVLTDTTFAYQLNGTIPTIIFKKIGSGSLKLIMVS